MEPTSLYARSSRPDVEVLLTTHHWRPHDIVTASDRWNVLSFSLSARPPGSRARFHSPGGHFHPVGDIVFLPAGVPMIASCDGGSQTILRCRIGETRFASLGGKTGGWTGDELRMGLNLAGDQLRGSLAGLAQEIANPGFASGVLIDAIATTLVVDLLRLFGRGAGRDISGGGLTGRQLRLIEDRVREDPLPSVGALAAMLGMSSRHLLRGFRKTTGTTLRASLQTAGRDRAIDLLTRTDWPIERIARQLGFRSQGSFSTAFRNMLGESPSAFRLRRR
jgi:AraC family transcriptional regulator